MKTWIAKELCFVIRISIDITCAYCALKTRTKVWLLLIWHTFFFLPLVVQLTYEDNYFEIVYMIPNDEGGNKIVFIQITDFLLCWMKWFWVEKLFLCRIVYSFFQRYCKEQIKNEIYNGNGYMTYMPWHKKTFILIVVFSFQHIITEVFVIGLSIQFASDNNKLNFLYTVLPCNYIYRK